MNKKMPPPFNTTVSLELVTPAIAEQWLANPYPGQRTMRDNHVLRLASDMEEGNFNISPDAILLVKGLLANGQHRLQGVVLSGVSCWFIVMRTDDEKVFWITDDGSPRHLRDYVKPMGVNYASDISSCASLVLQYDQGALCPHGVNHRRTATRSTLLAYVEKHRDALEEDSATVRTFYGATRVLAPSVGAALLHLLNRGGAGAKGLEFVRGVYYGDRQDASYDVRERLLKGARKGARMDRSHVFGLLIKAYRCYTNGTRPGVLRLLEGEEYPKLP